MPCQSDYPPPPDPRIAKYQELVAIVCEACQMWGDRPMPERLRLWWRDHQLEDQARMDALSAQRERNIARLRQQQKQIAAELKKLGDE